MKDAVIGIDIGTTGCRALVCRPDGTLLAGLTVEYPLFAPRSAWAEQNPEEIYAGFEAVVAGAVRQAGLKPDQIAGICFSSVFHSLTAVDNMGNSIFPLLIWADNRSQSVMEELKERLDGKAVYNRTGCPLHPMYPLAKIAWLKAEKPDIFQQAAKFISIKEFIIHKLTGRYIVDRSIASGSGLYNFCSDDWDPELLEHLEIGPDRLSEVLPGGHIATGIKINVAAKLGVSPDIALILGAGDGAMAVVGSGITKPGIMSATVGTSGAVRMLTPVPVVDEKSRTWCYNMNDAYWMAGAAINNGGISLRWVRDEIAEYSRDIAAGLGLDAYEVLGKAAASVQPGSDGLIMLPLFAGERAPNWNANARGVLFGMALNHTKQHIVRATMEGVMYRMYSIFCALADLTGLPEEIRVTGSFTRSPLWVQIMADVFGRPIVVPSQQEGVAFGASAFGMAALGLLSSQEAIGGLVTAGAEYQPISANIRIYRELFGIYRRIYDNLQQEFHAIAQVQRKFFYNEKIS